MKLRRIIINVTIFLLAMLFLDRTQIFGQGVGVSTPSTTEKEQKIKLISDAKILLEGELTREDEVKIFRGKDGFEFSIRRKGRNEREVYDHKGKKSREEKIAQAGDRENSIIVSENITAHGEGGDEIGANVISFSNGVKAEVPISHGISISPNHKYAFTFPGEMTATAREKEWFARLYDGKGSVLWEYSDLIWPSSATRSGGFPVYWAPDDDYFILNKKGGDEGVILFSKKGYEWSYTADEKDARSVSRILIAKGAAKVCFSIRYQLNLSDSERMEIMAEGKRRGLTGWIPAENPFVFNCFDKKGKFLWHNRELRHPTEQFSSGGKYLLYTKRSTDSKREVIQIFNTDTGDILHAQEFSHEDSVSKRLQVGLEFDEENKQLAFLLREGASEGGSKMVPLKKGFSLQPSEQPFKLHIYGYRVAVYDLSDVLP